ncbi:MAG: hypothetical protein KF866_00690 [Phycisphaeraceae bacterium]|nr:hypothetical protein [Phycisphaeraceae bacterium]MCW5755138.1 hypothetical protein [Phycisphaeraceae bacterium]
MHRHILTICGIAAGLVAGASAQVRVIDYEDLEEGFYGQNFTHMGVTYHTINQVSGRFPDGDTFGPQPDDRVIIENAQFAYDAFPGWGSANMAMTFGNAYVNGPNLSIGRVSSVTMDLDEIASFASINMMYYENGPWGGISWHFDALYNGIVVASDSFVIADGGGRDNPAPGFMSVEAPAFNQLHLYARYGDDYSLPRTLIDDLTLHIVPTPGTLAVAGLLSLAGLRRRR